WPPRPPLPAVDDPPLEPPAGPSPPSGTGFNAALPQPNPNEASPNTTIPAIRMLLIARDSTRTRRRSSARDADALHLWRAPARWSRCRDVAMWRCGDVAMWDDATS